MGQDAWVKLTALATTVTAVVASIAVLVAVYQLRLQSRLARYTTAFDAVWKLDNEWESARMQAIRRAAAKAIAEKQETADIDDVIDFFDKLGLLEKRHVIDDELLWHRFYYCWPQGYWPLTRDYIERVRRDEPSVWEDAVDLVRRLDAVEAQRSHRPTTGIVPTPEEVRDFLTDEQQVGVDAVSRRSRRKSRRG